MHLAFSLRELMSASCWQVRISTHYTKMDNSNDNSWDPSRSYLHQVQYDSRAFDIGSSSSSDYPSQPLSHDGLPSDAISHQDPPWDFTSNHLYGDGTLDYFDSLAGRTTQGTFMASEYWLTSDATENQNSVVGSIQNNAYYDGNSGETCAKTDCLISHSPS